MTNDEISNDEGTSDVRNPKVGVVNPEPMVVRRPNVLRNRRQLNIVKDPWGSFGHPSFVIFIQRGLTDCDVCRDCAVSNLMVA